MDPILAAKALPRLAERAMRAAILEALGQGRLTPRSLVDRALVGFERAAQRYGPLRPALLFAERDRIARELRAFIDGRLAARLRALRRDDLIAIGRGAKPFDVLVRNRRGRVYAVVFRRLPRDGRRLERFARMREAAQNATRTPLHGVLVYDFSRGAALLLNESRAQGVYRYLRAS
jgi:hypothetical protein